MMRRTWLPAVLILAWPVLAQAQTPELQNAVNQRLREARNTVQLEGAYENIEIMRRILQRALNHAYAPQHADGQALGSYYLSGIADPNVLGGRYAAHVNSDSGIATSFDAQAQAFQTYQAADWLSNAYQQPRLHIPSTDVEGVYLRGQGVVYTVTLPAHERVILDPHSRQLLNVAYCTSCHVETFKLPTDKALPTSDQLPSLWEQTRREVKGVPSDPAKKPAADAKKLEICGPGTVGDTLLRILADNGKHLGLTPKENVTVVVTFRPTPPASRSGYGRSGAAAPANMPAAGTAQADPNLTGRVSSSGDVQPAAGTGAVSAAQPAGTTGTATPRDEKVAAPESWKQSYERLGDLHMKQKHYSEAIEAYQKALGEVKEKKSQDAVRGKLLDALKAQLGVIDAVLAESKETQDLRKKLLESADAYLKGLDTELGKQLQAKPKSTPLPAKLIVTASRELLDQVGQGKLSFEDFKKSAGVEYVTFGASVK